MIPPTLRSDQVAHTQAPAEPNTAPRAQGLAQVPDTMEHIAQMSCCSILSDMCSAISSVYQKCVQWVRNQFVYFFLTDREAVEDIKNQFTQFLHSITTHDRFGDLNQLGATNIKGLMIFELDGRIIGFKCESIAIDDVQAFLNRSCHELNRILDDEIIHGDEKLSFRFIAASPGFLAEHEFLSRAPENVCRFFEFKHVKKLQSRTPPDFTASDLRSSWVSAFPSFICVTDREGIWTSYKQWEEAGATDFHNKEQLTAIMQQLRA